MLFYEPLFSIFIYFIISIIICLVILLICYLINTPHFDNEKNISYECGFKPFDFVYYAFDVQFYRVGILFLLFDVEIIFFFPWLLNFYIISIYGHLIIIIFIFFLFFGFLYEIKIKALVWYPQPWKFILK
jgi:NADH:ubiquinone oxidoreductase subunit 3 (subunit A)